MNNDPSLSDDPTPSEAESSPRALVPAEIAQPGPPEEEEVVSQPAKLMRIASMAKQLLEEVRMAPLDDASRTRRKEIYHATVGAREQKKKIHPGAVPQAGGAAPPGVGR